VDDQPKKTGYCKKTKQNKTNGIVASCVPANESLIGSTNERSESNENTGDYGKQVKSFLWCTTRFTKRSNHSSDSNTTTRAAAVAQQLSGRSVLIVQSTELESKKSTGGSVKGSV
jgi:hypothetical protein